MQLNRIACKIPHDCYLAISGGVDSVAALGFLLAGNRNVELLHFNHGTGLAANKAEELVLEIAEKHSLHAHVGGIDQKDDNHIQGAGESREAYWRRIRYRFFDDYDDKPIILAHHLDDAVETYLFNAFNGKLYTMPIQRDHFIRPFLTFRKEHLNHMVKFVDSGWVTDPSNEDLSFARNRIRHKIVPQLKYINPGLHTVVLKKIREAHAANK